MRASDSDRNVSMFDAVTHDALVDDYRRIVEDVVPIRLEDTKESWAIRAARKFGVTPRRIRAVRERKVGRLDAVEYERAKRLEKEARRQEMQRLEQQVALAYARERDSKDEFIKALVEVLGPRHPLVLALAGQEAGGAAVPEKDGATKMTNAPVGGALSE